MNIQEAGIVKLISLKRSRAFWYSVIYVPLLVIIYFNSYKWLVKNDWPREDYNYCYLIPFVVLYLIWDNRNKWQKEAPNPSWTGLLFLIPGILLFFIGELAGEFFSIYISSWLVVVGLLWVYIGWKKLRIMAFPIFISLFLFPLPYFINTKLTFGLKLISSEIGIRLIQLFGMSAYREGNIIDLGFTQLQVVDACSGLRYLIPLLLMGILMAYFYRAALWKRIVIVLSAIPLSIITNSLRIAFTAILYPSMGPAAAEGFFHDFSGWAIFVVSFLGILSEIWILGKIMPQPSESFMKKKSGAEERDDEKWGKFEKLDIVETKNTGRFFIKPQFIVAAVILSTALAIYSIVDFSEKKPISQSFNAFPLAIEEWKGERQFIDQQFIEELDLSDYVSIDYSKNDSMPINLYVAYYASQQKGKSIHSPETCLPGSGWVFKNAGTVNIPLSDKTSSSITVMRALMEKDGNMQLVYFWFNQRGRILTNAYEMKIYNFWDSLVKRRTDGALIRVISPIASSEKIEEADTRLKSFISEAMPLLNEFIPR
jgi:exosortase D (VPLPA-CTERM-specific)